jgi:hypothetical protein
VVCFFETLVDFQLTTRHDISKASTFKMHANFSKENLKERNHLEDLGVIRRVGERDLD